MAKALRGELEVKLGDHIFTLRLSLGNLEELEAQTGVGILTLAQRFADRTTIRLSDARAVLRQGFIGSGHKITEKELSDLIEEAGIGALASAADLLLSCFVDQSGNAGAVAGKKGKQATAG
jgi:hypothetical protein